MSGVEGSGTAGTKNDTAENKPGGGVDVEPASISSAALVRTTSTHTTSIRVPFALSAALSITLAATLIFGILPGTLTHFTTVSLLG